MKKNLLILCSLFVGMTFVACSNDDGNEKKSEVLTSVFSVPNATYKEEAFPIATTNDRLEGVSVPSNVAASGISTIKISKNRDYTRFFIGVKGQSGYFVYTLNDTRAYDLDEDGDDGDFWVIPITYGPNLSSGTVGLLSAEDKDGKITKPYEFTINYTDTKTQSDFSILMNGNTILSCQYDKNGRLIHLNAERLGGVEELTITYSGEQPSKLVMVNDGEISTFTNISTNSMGYITSMSGNVTTNDNRGGATETMSFIYNSDGYLTSYKDIYSDQYGVESITHTLSWNNGNLTSHKIVDSDGESDEYVIAYGSLVNEKQQGTIGQWYSGWGELCFTTLWGKHSTNLPVSVSGGKGYQFTYELNPDGSIKSEAVNGRSCDYSY